MITSSRNVRVQSARRLTKRGVRDDRREFLIEGALGVEQALRTSSSVKSLMVCPQEDSSEVVRLASSKGIPVVEVSEAVMRSISSATTPPGVLAVSRFVDRDPVALLRERLDLVVVLAGVRDPGNAGTIIRSAAAVGADALFIGGTTVDLYNPKVVRATAGALFNVPVSRNVEVRWLLSELGDRKVGTIAADPEGPTVYHDADLTKPTALVLGNEAWGVTREVVESVDSTVCIPMKHGVESLNVGMAASVVLFEAARQRRTRDA